MSRLGPLQEREFRLLFFARAVSFFGTAIAPVALAFAVLEIAGPTELGLVLAARLVPQVALLLLGGVWADRLPRNVVMVGSNVVCGLAQGAIGVLLLADVAEVWHLAALAAVNGAAAAFFFPASQGIIPQTVSPARLQQANVLLRLGLNGTLAAGAAAGGILVAKTGSGWALVFDGATYFAAAGLLLAMKLSHIPVAAKSVLHDLRIGWGEFRARTWLWAIVLAFGFLNAAWSGARDVLAPIVAKQDLGGADAYGFLMGSFGVGLIVGGIIAFRYRPSRLLFVGCGVMVIGVSVLVSLALAAPLAVLCAAALATGIGYELFGVFWDTALQQNIRQDVLSRVYAYDALGSWVLMPVGVAVAGPLSEAIGIDRSLWLFTGVILLCWGGMLAVPDVRAIRRKTDATTVERDYVAGAPELSAVESPSHLRP
jgi:MFS family permease